jgi:hypothetical protein
MRGKPFEPGQSGNPAGRPVGSRNKATLAIESLLEGELESITRAAVEAAKNGDMAAVRIVMDRVYPARKSRPIHIELPPVADAAGVSAALDAVLVAVSNGELLLEEAEALTSLLEARRRAIETHDFELRIQRLEERQ